MVDLTISGQSLLVHVRGMHKVWALKSFLEIPLAHIVEVRADSQIAHRWYHGIRLPGTNIPGVLTAGTFYQNGKKSFWDIHDPDKVVVIELTNEPYDRLVVEVVDPKAAVEIVKGVLPVTTSRDRGC